MVWKTRDKINVGLALATLGVSVAFMQAAQSQGWLSLVKKRLPVQRPLREMDRSVMDPFVLISSQELPAETVEELGTEEYINWILKEPSSSPYKGRLVNLAVTYYTGVVDQVPHVPEECMVQGAFTQDGDETLQMELPSIGRTIEVRRLQFYPPRDLSVKTYVYYTFCVNGDFLASRMSVRTRMTKWSDTHLYYAKIEVSFKGRPGTELSELDARAQDVLDRSVSELLKSHFPPAEWAQGGPRDSAAPTASADSPKKS